MGLAIIIALFFWLLRRTRKRKEAGMSKPDEVAEYRGPTGAGNQRGYIAEADSGHAKYEVSGQSAGPRTAELEGDYRR